MLYFVVFSSTLFCLEMGETASNIRAGALHHQLTRKHPGKTKFDVQGASRIPTRGKNEARNEGIVTLLRGSAAEETNWLALLRVDVAAVEYCPGHRDQYAISKRASFKVGGGISNR